MKMRWLFVLTLVLALLAASGGLALYASAAAPLQTLLYQDDFEDGDYTQAQGANGLTWSVVSGGASVNSIDGSFQLGVNRGLALIATTQRITGNEYTVRLDGRITWSTPGRIVVLYKDENNYYSVGLGNQPGIYRKLNGSEVQLHTDPESLVRLPHGSAVTGTFKVYVHNTGQSIVVKADKAGDGVDYDIEILDADPAAVAMFTHTGIGMMSGGDEPNPPWFYIDDLAIYDGLLVDSYTPATYYVDQNHPQASDDNPGTESLPWLTIQKAADSVWAGDTVIVKAGAYNERITFANGTRGAPGQIITFKAQPRRTVTMWGFYTRYAHYLRMEGFNIITDPSLTGWTERNGVFISSDHVEVVDNYLYNLRSTAVSGTSVGAIVAHNRIYHSQAGLGISGSDWVVEGNEVERLFDYGGGDCDYSRFFGDNHVIHGNFFHGTLFNEVGDAHVDCFQIFDNNGEFAHHVIFDGNVCYDFHQGFMGEAAYYRDISDLIFRNNIFAHGGAWGLCVHQIQNVTAMHNVFADIQYHGIGFRDGATGVVRNNIFYNAGSNYWASSGGSVKGSHNILYQTDGSIDPGDFPNDLVNIDPLFVNPAADDYHIRAGSPAIDAGLNVGVTTDLEGTPRPQGAGYDIGAYEFTPALALSGIPGSGTIYLNWNVNFTLPLTSTWRIDHASQAGTAYLPITGITNAVRAYTLTGLTNYVWYTVALNAMLNNTPFLTDTVRVMPTDIQIYLPLVLRQSQAQSAALYPILVEQLPGAALADGGWSYWYWTPCTKGCRDAEGWGARQRIHVCNNPAPSAGGAECRRRDGTFTTPSNRVEIDLSVNSGQGYIECGNPTSEITCSPAALDDVTPPTTPQNLQATVLSDSKIRLRWDHSTDNVAVVKYRIYDQRDFVIGVSQETYYTPPGYQTNVYTVSLLTPATAYSFNVTAVDEHGNESEHSPTVMAATLPFQHSNTLLNPFTDIVYKGAFKLPGPSGDLEYGRWGYGGYGLAYYPQGDPGGSADGYPGSLFGRGHVYDWAVSEISIPAPVISYDKDMDDLNTAATLQPFTRVDTFDRQDLSIPIGGMAYLPRQGSQASDKLYYIWGSNYNWSKIPSHSASELTLNDPQTQGWWYVGDADGHPPYYSTVFYLFDIPQAWADQYTGGKMLLTGGTRSGAYNGFGTAMFAIGPWQDGNPPPFEAELSYTTLVEYGQATGVNTQDGREVVDQFHGGAWIIQGGKTAVMLIGNKSTGEVSYSGGYTPSLDWPVFMCYDPDDLAAVAAGHKAAHEPQPYAMLDVSEYFFTEQATLRGAAYDRARGLLYIYEYNQEEPLIHVFQIAPAPAELTLRGAPASRAIHLTWEVNATLPVSATWTIDYASQGGTAYPPIAGIISSTRAYTLTGLTNYVPYTVTLSALTGSAVFLSDAVTVTPTDHLIYLPLVLRTH